MKHRTISKIQGSQIPFISLASIAFAAMTGTSHAGVVFGGITNSTGFTVDSTSPLSIVHADLAYNTGENNAVPGGPFYWDTLDNGSATGSNKTGATVIGGDAGPNGLLWSFAGGPTTLGSISVYSGWADTGRMEQHFSVYYTTDATVNGSSTWTLLGTVGGSGNNGSTTYGSGANNQLKTTLYNSTSGTLQTGVTGLRFNFGGNGNLVGGGGQQNGGVGYKEIDVSTLYTQTGAWTSTSSGNWSDNASWSSGLIASGADQTASIDGASGVTLTVDSARTIGNLSFDNANHALTSGTLTLQTTSGTPTITVGATGGVRSASISSEIAGNNGLTKSGTGTLTLSGTNSYTGTTTVSAGTLLVNGSTAAGSALSVNSGATLGGTGTIAGNTTVNGTLNAGNGGNTKETLAFGGTLDLSGATTIFDIGGSTRGTDYDGIDITGALTNGGILSLNFTNTLANGTYLFDLLSFGSQSNSFSSVSVIGSYVQTLTNNGFGVWSGTDGSGNSWTFTQSTGDLGFTAVPELSNVLIGALLGAGMLRRRRTA